jgi:hypothetical protein
MLSEDEDEHDDEDNPMASPTFNHTRHDPGDGQEAI